MVYLHNSLALFKTVINQFDTILFMVKIPGKLLFGFGSTYNLCDRTLLFKHAGSVQQAEKIQISFIQSTVRFPC
jgi:hypothetical protein